MLNTLPDKDWIARHIPHQGRMCLLDRVEAWDTEHITCAANSHRASDHPLRAFGRLGAACGIEYAAQAMAVHGALLASPSDPTARAGYLVSVRETRLRVARLDDLADDIIVEAESMARDAHTVHYRFAVRAGGRLLLEGRAMVVLDADALESSGKHS